jgi:hypothetical protein
MVPNSALATSIKRAAVPWSAITSSPYKSSQLCFLVGSADKP